MSQNKITKLWKKPVLCAGVIVIITFIAYIPALKAGFVWDDNTFLTANPLIKAPDGLYWLWFTTESPDYFPLVSTSLWLEWRLWGMNAVGYHFTNVLLHAISAIVLWRVLKRLKIPCAWLAAAVFAIHPVNVESVAWITERQNTLPMVFYLLSILFYLRFYAKIHLRWYVLSLVMFALGLLAKTSVVMLPVVLLLCVWWEKKAVTFKDLLRTVPFFALSGIFGLVTIWFQYNRAIGQEVIRADSFFSRLATAGCAVWFYLYKAIIPYKLTFVYPRWNIDSSSVISYLPLILLLVCFGIFWIYRRSWARPFLFAFGYFVVTLLPVLGFFNIYFMKYSLVADHWQYVSIPAVIALLIGLGKKLGTRLQVLPGVKFIVPALLIGACGALTWQQSRIYKNLETLWDDTLEKNPTCAMAHSNLGIYLFEQGRADEATEHFFQAIKFKPDFAMAHNNLGIVFAKKGRAEEAIGYFEKSLAIDPNYAGAHYNLGNLLSDMGRLDDSKEHLVRAREIYPSYADAHYLLGFVMHRQGEIEKAIASYSKALRIDEQNHEAHYKLAIALTSVGRVAQAVEHFQKALQLKPDWPEALNSLAVVFITRHNEKLYDPSEAVKFAERACQLTDFREPVLLDTLAVVYAQIGRLDEAVAIAEKAVGLAEMSNRQALAEAIRARLSVYKSKKNLPSQ